MFFLGTSLFAQSYKCKNLKNMNKRNIQDLLPLYFENQLNEEDNKNIEEWIQENPRHQSIADEMAHIYLGIDALYIKKNTDADKAYQKIQGRLFKQRIQKAITCIEHIAAILLIPVLMLCAWQFYQTSNKKNSLLSYTANPGMTAKVQLPDGSTVILNSNSTITYPTEFNDKQREVKLLGEAYFQVSKDTERPFIVTTPYRANIKVYGTEFNVEAYEKDNTLTATLKEGSIALSFIGKDGKQQEQLLFPGQAITYRNNSQPTLISKAQVDIATSWTEGKIIFRNTPFKEVIQKLEKSYNVQFRIHNPNVYKNCFTGTLSNQRLDRILYILSQTSDIKFKHQPTDQASNYSQIIEIY